jgi:histone H3/H4
MLATSIGNRNINKLEVRRLAALMTSGKWIFNGNPITFDVNGNLTNGHHRLTACVHGKAFFQTLVVVGVEEDSRLVDDTHRPKTASDLLAFSMPQGIKPYGNRYMAGYLAFMMYTRESTRPLNKTDVARFAHETNYQLVSGEVMHKIRVSTINRYTSLLIAIEGIIRNAINEKRKTLTEEDYNRNMSSLGEFVDRLIDGENINAGSAIYALRERLLRYDAAIMSNTGRQRFLRACIVAYNNHVTGQPVSKVILNLAGGHGTALTYAKPRIIGVS